MTKEAEQFMTVNAQEKKKKKEDAKKTFGKTWKDFNADVGQEIKNVLFAKGQESFT
jgi:hypothetical protein